MNINWYPGHMKKSLDKIRQSMKMVDIVLEIVDARIPISSRNPVLDDIIGDFPRLIIFNKSDMADPKETKKWIKYFNDKNIEVLEYNAIKDNKTNELYKLARKTLQDLFEKRANKNIQNKSIKMMIVGIPNVGKSTFINNISKKKKAVVGNRPGVTRNNQWIRTNSDIMLLDTPGVLWPKLELFDGGKNLAFTGSIKDEILNIEDLAYDFIKYMQNNESDKLEKRYKLDSNLETIQILDKIALNTGSILKGQEIDYFKVSNIIFDDFRKLRLGRISLEKVENIQ